MPGLRGAFLRVEGKPLRWLKDLPASCQQAELWWLK